MHKTAHELSTRHFRRVICCPQDTRRRMAHVWAMTWRPGDKSSSFLDNVFRPRTSPVCIVQSSEVARRPKSDNQQRRRKGRSEHIYLNGYLAQIDPDRGELSFGGESGNCFAYDFALQPHPGAEGKIVNVTAKPDLVHVGLELHRLRQRAVSKNHKLPVVPQLPSCYLGFRENSLPEMEDTPALRQRVARAMRRPIDYVNAMDDDELQPLLRAEWPSCFRKPGEGGNNTDLWLISHQLCTKVRHALRDFLCFEDLAGSELYNPIRKLLPSNGRTPTVRNPAEKVLRNFNFKPGEVDDWAEVLGNDEKLLADIVVAMRKALGDVEMQFTDEQIIDLLLDYKSPAPLPTFDEDPLKILGEERVLALMRHHVGRYSDCCRDEDLLKAAAHPGQPLYAAGLLRVQVLYAPQRIPAYYMFGGEELNLDRVSADFISVRAWWEHASHSPARRNDSRGLAPGV